MKVAVLPKMVVESRLETTIGEPTVTDGATYFDFLRARTQFIGPPLALKMLETLAYTRQRQIREHHVEYLAKSIKRGELKTLLIQEAEMPDGSKILVDGYHRLTAVVMAGQGLPAAVITHKVGNERELGTLYATLDRPLIRQPRDMAVAYGLHEQTKLTRRELMLVGAAVFIVAYNFQKFPMNERKSLIERTEDTEKWLAEGEAYFESIADSTKQLRSKLERASVIAVALATFRHQPGPAEQFWGAIAKNDGLRRNTPQATLLDWLQANPVSKIGQHTYTKYVASAWNAFYEGREISRLLMRDPASPITILGTPYRDGREVV